CGCGRRGCLEAFAGRLAISGEAAALVARGLAPRLEEKAGSDVRHIKSGALARAVEAGDRPIEELIRRKARRVGVQMGNLVNVLNPELIVLGGGLVEAMPLLIAREAEAAMRETALASSSRQVRVAIAKLKDRSVVMGAAKRAYDRFSH